MKVSIFVEAGDFAEDKDAAARVRRESIEPALRKGQAVTLDFARVRLTTQSFVHALISGPLREHGERALDLLEFKSCSRLVRGIIVTVVQYSLESIEE